MLAPLVLPGKKLLGAPQGSVSGPPLLNIVLCELFI